MDGYLVHKTTMILSLGCGQYTSGIPGEVWRRGWPLLWLWDLYYTVLYYKYVVFMDIFPEYYVSDWINEWHTHTHIERMTDRHRVTVPMWCCGMVRYGSAFDVSECTPSCLQYSLRCACVPFLTPGAGKDVYMCSALQQQHYLKHKHKNGLLHHTKNWIKD